MSEEEGLGVSIEGDAATQLGSFVGLRALLDDKDVKAVLTAELSALGFPAPGLVYRCIVFAAGKSQTFLGGAISSRLQAFIDRRPQLAGLIGRIASLHEGAQAKGQLKDDLIAAIREGRPFETDINVDDATSLELAIALHSGRKLEDISGAVDALGSELAETLCSEIAALQHEIFRPNLSWPEEATNKEALSAYNRLKYTSGLDAFRGREGEIELLHRFAGDPTMGGDVFNFRWMLLTAEGGSGKTRLAYHFTRTQLPPEHWEAGKLDLRELSGFSEPGKWRPRKPTFIVIDYAQSAPEHINRLLAAFTAQSKNYDFPVRLLLLERNSYKAWTDKMLPDTGDAPAIIERDFLESNGEGVALPPVSPEYAIPMMAARIAQAGMAEVPPEQLWEFAHQVDPQMMPIKREGEVEHVPAPRPLFCLAAADALIDALRADGALPSKLDREDVLDGIITRDRQTIWAKAVPSDQLRRYELGFAMATLIQGVSLGDLSADHFAEVRDWLPPLPPSDNPEVLAAFGCVDGVWAPMEPDILGEYFFAQKLLDPAMPTNVRHLLLLNALKVNYPQPLISLLRLARDLPETFEQLDLPAVTAANKDLETARYLADLTVDLVNVMSDRSTFCDAQMSALRAAFPEDREIALEEAKAAVNISNDAGGAGDWGRVDAMLVRLDALRAAFPEDREIAFEEAKAAFNISNDAGDAGDWDRVATALDRLDSLRAAFPKDRKIALREAKAAVNISSAAGDAGDWGRIDAMLELLDTLRAAFPEDREIALHEAQAVVNISSYAGDAGDVDRVDAMLARLDSLRAAFPEDREIASEAAKAAVNISNAACRADDWGRVDAMLARLDALRAAFPEDREIASVVLRGVGIEIAMIQATGEDTHMPRLRVRVEALTDLLGADAEVAQFDDGRVTLGDVLKMLSQPDGSVDEDQP